MTFPHQRAGVCAFEDGESKRKFHAIFTTIGSHRESNHIFQLFVLFHRYDGHQIRNAIPNARVLFLRR